VDVEPSVRDHILGLEQRLLQPDLRRSPKELEVLLADDFLEYGSSGSIYRKRDVIEALQHESPQLRLLTEFHVVALSSDVVLATYRIARQGPPEHAPSHSLRSSVWRLNLGKWQLQFHQGTPCPPAI
jgi:hypothetical protein